MISTDTIDDILVDWKSRMMGGVASSTRRELDLKGQLRPELATIISGPRRAGKSTYLGQLPSLLRLPVTRCWFCNFEDPALALELGPALLDAIYQRIRLATPAGKVAYVFFDEIQTVPLWEKWLHKALIGKNDCVYILTGSNASMLSGELATSLTGRYRSYELFPFSLSELRAARGATSLEDYLRLGGFPIATNDVDPSGYLKELFRNIVLRDIAPRVGARSSNGLIKVVTSVYQSVGSEVSHRRIASAVGLSTDTVSQYIEACEQAYLLFACPYFTHSERQSAHRPRKYYAIDTAMRQAISGTRERDRGKSLENLVYTTLRRQGLSVSYWRDGGEVDFVVRVGNRFVPLQVSWSGAVERHTRALEEFYAKHPYAEEAVFIDAKNGAEFVERPLDFFPSA